MSAFARRVLLPPLLPPLLPLLGLLLLPLTARAQRPWSAPLDRLVSVRGGELALRDALDRIAAAAGVRISYSDAVLPLERRVRLELSAVPLGDALTTVMDRPDIVPRAAGPELVVLVPQAVSKPAERPPAVRTMRAAPLERVVVTGTAGGGAQRPLTVSVGVVDGLSLESQGRGDVAGQLNGALAGLWIWAQSPNVITARYGSVRGASSFGVSYPKIYVDGVEVANPLIVAHVPAESIERLELLRGPQGAALYGTDAISGVLQVVTRQPSNAEQAPALRLRAQSGFVSSSFAEDGTLSQDVSVAGQHGSIARAVSGNLSFSRLGAFVPEGESQRFNASARGRLLGSNALLEGTARLGVSDVASSSNPLLLAALSDAIVVPDSVRFPRAGDRLEQRLRDSLAARLGLDRVARQSLRQFTGGITGTLHSSARWTHKITLGVDAYALDGAPAQASPLPSSSDSALLAAEGSAVRTSARASTALRVAGTDWSRTLTLLAEHAVLREATSNAVLVGPRRVTGIATTDEAVWRQTSGVVAQLDLAWRNTFFVTGGTRVERSAGFTAEPLVTWLPMLGASWVTDVDAATVKLRGAYGKGIRPPRVTVGGASVAAQRLLPNPELQPESQAGTEFGADIFSGRTVAVHVTRFDQRASGLVQPVTVLAPGATPGGGRPGDPLGRNLAYQLQNVGAIENRGWELEAVMRRGALALQGSWTHVDSRVADVRRGYTGELRVGDRMLDVPEQTIGASAQWAGAGWAGGVRVSRAFDWIGYDRAAAAGDWVRPSTPASTFVGSSLRDFWITYPGVTRVGAFVSRDLPLGLTAELRGENLLDRQLGEPDNITIVPGRAISLGVRARF